MKNLLLSLLLVFTAGMAFGETYQVENKSGQIEVFDGPHVNTANDWIHLGEFDGSRPEEYRINAHISRDIASGGKYPNTFLVWVKTCHVIHNSPECIPDSKISLFFKYVDCGQRIIFSSVFFQLSLDGEQLYPGVYVRDFADSIVDVDDAPKNSVFYKIYQHVCQPFLIQ